MNELKIRRNNKTKKRTPKQKELLNLFSDLSDTVLSDETLESKTQEKENENKNENDKNESENEDENKNILLEYIENVDDKLFKEYSKGKNFNSFINEFDRATNKEDKEKIVQELKDINSFVEHYAQMEDNYNEYENKIFDIINAVDYFVYNALKNGRVILIVGNTQTLLRKKIFFFLCMYKMYLISAEGYKNVNVEFLTIKTTSEIWVSMKDVGSGMGVKNISDLILKEIYDICETKDPSKEQVNEYKMTESLMLEIML